MKKIIASLALFAAVLSQASSPLAAETLVIGVTPFPHKDIIEVAAPLLKKDGYDVKIMEFNDYVVPNVALAEKQLFANFFQHVPYLDKMNAERGLKLAWIAMVHIEPLGLYSQKIKKLDELKPGSVVAVPNDPTNEARALRLMETHGLIKLKPGALVTVIDIVDNPKKLNIKELEAAQLPRSLPDVAAAVINTNFAAEAGLTPSKDAIIIEGKESPYANVVAVREADKDSPAAKALAKAVNSPEVKEYIKKELEPKGIVPAF